MRLNDIKDREGAFSSQKRLGKGQGSGTGKTAGRGMKGQKSRSGSAMKGFEGGQMPLYRRVPKRGFNNPFREEWQEVNVGRIEKYIELGKLDGGKDIDAQALFEAGLIRRMKDRIKLLGKGELKVKNLHLVVDGISSGARASLEQAGGRVTIRDRKAYVREEKEAKKIAKKEGVSEEKVAEKVAEKVTEKKAVAEKVTAKKPAVKKVVAKEAVAEKKPVVKKAAVKKAAVKKPAVKKVAAKKSEEGGDEKG